MGYKTEQSTVFILIGSESSDFSKKIPSQDRSQSLPSCLSLIVNIVSHHQPLLEAGCIDDRPNLYEYGVTTLTRTEYTSCVCSMNSTTPYVCNSDTTSVGNEFYLYLNSESWPMADEYCTEYTWSFCVQLGGSYSCPDRRWIAEYQERT